MKKKLFIIVLFIFVLPAFAQDLQDVEIIAKDATEVYITKYGYLIEYPTSNLYKANLFLPFKWFRIPEDGEERSIVGRRKVTYLNIDVPSFKISYLDSEAKYITLLVPKHYIETGFPMYYGDMADEELKAAFDEQSAKSTIDIL